MESTKMLTGIDFTSTLAKSSAIALAFATTAISPVMDSNSSFQELNCSFFKDRPCNSLKVHSHYSTDSIKMDDEYTACRTDGFFWINKNFVIETKDASYIKNYSYTYDGLLKLRLIIDKEFDKVDVILKPFNSGEIKGLLVGIPLSDKVEEDFLSLDKVCKKWFSETELDINSNIYIDLV